MQHMAEIYKQIVELKKQEMAINFTPVSARSKSFITELRKIKGEMAKLLTELSQLKAAQANIYKKKVAR